MRGREAVLSVPCRPPVNVVDASIEFIWHPEGVVNAAAGHGVRAEEDVERVPDHERERDEKPGEEEGWWGVRVC